MRKLGITLPHLGGSQIGLEVFEAIRELFSQDYLTDVSVYYETVISEAFDWPCASFPLFEVCAFNGPVIATTLNAAEELIKSIPVPKKFFYVYDLEWVHGPQKTFTKIAEIYRHPKLTLLTRTVEHAKCLENGFGVKATPINKLSLLNFICSN